MSAGTVLAGGNQPGAPDPYLFRIRDLVYRAAGIFHPDNKLRLLEDRCGRRMKELETKTLREYFDRLMHPSLAREEMVKLLNEVTIGETCFLRNQPQLDALKTVVWPHIIAARAAIPIKKLRIWSAGCSTGEEPYTMAFYLEDRFPSSAGWDWRIRATDISTRALDKAARGIYPDERLTDLPRDWVRKYFQRGVGGCAGHCRVKSHLQQRISFEQMNLLDTSHDDGTFEVIFCRNVMIYFDRPTQEQVVARLSRALRPGGYLFTGRSESLSGLVMPLKGVRPSIYQKPG